MQDGHLVGELDTDPGAGERQPIRARRGHLGGSDADTELVKGGVDGELGRPDLGGLAVDDDLHLSGVPHRDGRDVGQGRLGCRLHEVAFGHQDVVLLEQLADRRGPGLDVCHLSIDAQLDHRVAPGESGDAEHEGHHQGTLENGHQSSRHPIDASGDHPLRANWRPQGRPPSG